MEENNKIDDIFRSGLNDMEMEPSANSWDAIASKLNAKKAAKLKKKRVLWFSAATLLLLISYTTVRFTNLFSTVSSNEKVQPENVQSHPIASQIESTNPVASDITESASQNSTGSSTGSNPVNPAPSSNSDVSPISSKTENVSSNQPASVNASVVPVTRNSQASASNSQIAKNESKPVSTQSDNTNANTQNTPSAPQQTELQKSPVTTSTPTEKQPDNLVPVAVTAATAGTAAATSRSSQKPAEVNSSAQSSTPTESTPERKSADDKKSGSDSNLIPAAVTGGMIAAGKANENTHSDNSTNNVAPENKTNDQSINESATKLNEAIAQTDSTVATEPKISDYSPQANPESSPSLLKRIISHMSVDVYYTPEFVETAMKVNEEYTGPASKNLDDYKNETSQYSYSTGINLRYDIGSKWSVASGISSSSFSKSSVYNSISVVADSVFQEQYVERPWSHHSGGHGGGPGGGGGHGGGGHGGGGHGGGGPGGGHGHTNPGNPNDPNSNHHFVVHTSCGTIDLNNVPPNGNNSNNGDTLNIKTEVNQTISFINIPLLVRYSFGSKKLSWFVEAGGAINYVSTETVQVIINDATIEDNSVDAVSNMNYSVLLGFGAQYNFYKGLSMFAKPSLRYSVTPINIDSPVKSYPHYYGISGGIILHF